MPAPTDENLDLTPPVYDDTTGGGDRDIALLFACLLDGQGGRRPVTWAEIQEWRPTAPGEVLWLHLDRTHHDVPGFLARAVGMDTSTIQTLTSNETRPRTYMEGDGLVTILRGVNLNPGADPRDMIAMQVWSDESRVISLRRRRLQSPRDVLAALDAGVGPRTAGDLLSELIAQMVLKLGPTIADIDERIDALEGRQETRNSQSELDAVTKIRRYCLALKRFMTPQHEALMELLAEPPSWLSEDNRRKVRETVERLRRYLDDLDVSKESALVLQDDLNNRAANQTNRTMYMLSLVAAVFLPLGFLTGLLGINVGGMPGVNSTDAFWVTVAILLAVFVAQIFIFRKLKWF